MPIMVREYVESIVKDCLPLPLVVIWIPGRFLETTVVERVLQSRKKETVITLSWKNEIRQTNCRWALLCFIRPLQQYWFVPVLILALQRIFKDDYDVMESVSDWCEKKSCKKIVKHKLHESALLRCDEPLVFYICRRFLEYYSVSMSKAMHGSSACGFRSDVVYSADKSSASRAKMVRYKEWKHLLSVSSSSSF